MAWLYPVLTMDAQLLLSGKILKKELIKASALYKHIKIEVSGTAIIKKLVLSRTEDNKHCK